MSIDVNIHVFLDADKMESQLDHFSKALSCIAVPVHADREGPVTRFLELKAYNRGTIPSLKKEVNSNDVFTVIDSLKDLAGPTCHYEVSSAFDCLLYDDYHKAIKETVHPLTISYYGPEYGWRGFEFKRYGHIRIDFSNTKVFGIPASLLDDIKGAAQRGGDTTEGLKIIPRIGRNFNVVEDLAKKLIATFDPVHVVVCSNLEVTPFTSHAIYHRDIQDYVRDLQKIARLHEDGGLYFHNVEPDEPAFISARKTSPNYGLLRDKWAAGTEDEFAELLQPMVDTLLTRPEMLKLSNEEIEQILVNMDKDSTVAEKINDSYYVSVANPPWGYLEEPYFKFYEAIYGRDALKEDTELIS